MPTQGSDLCNLTRYFADRSKDVNIEVEETFSVDLCKVNPDKIYVFGDNLIGKGKKGQAIIRDCQNSFGVPTKRLPAMTEQAFFADREDEMQAVLESLRKLYRLSKDYTLVFPKAGLGTGLAQMEKRSPEIFKLMKAILKEHFGYEF